MSFFLFIVVPTFTPPSCYDGQFQLANSNYYYNYYTSLYSVSGYLTGCINGTFAPVCGEANIGRTELTFACYISNGVACKLSMCAVCTCSVYGNKYTCSKHQFHASWQPLSIIHILIPSFYRWLCWYSF